MPSATRQAFGETILELGETNKDLVVLDADLSKSTMTQAFMKKFPERHFEIGIAEQNMIGIAAGMALSGKIPIVTSFACFLIGRLETIRIVCAYNQTNVKLVGTHAGIGIGDDGTSQMALEDIGAMRSLPHLVTLQPADAVETKQAVRWMIEHEGSVYIRLTRQKMPDVHKPDYKFEFGKIDILWEPGSKPKHFQATILASGGTVPNALQAAKDLEGRGFNARVVNVHTLNPFDDHGLAEVAKDSERLVTVEDHNVIGGLGSAVCEAAAGKGIGIPVIRIGVKDFGESATGEELYEKYGLTADHIAEAAVRNLN